MDELLDKVKANLMVTHYADDDLIYTFIASAVSYAEAFQHLETGYYTSNDMTPTTKQAVIFLASYFYESRDGSTAGFYGDNTGASDNVWKVANRLLLLDRSWKL